MALKKNSKMNNGKAVYLNPEKELYTQFMEHKKLTRRILSPMYKNKCVIDKIIINDKMVVTQMFKGTTGNGPLVWATGADKEHYEKNEVIAFEVEDIANTKEFFSKECGYKDGRFCEYVYFGNLVQVKMADNVISRKMTQEGFSCKLNEKIKIGEEVKEEGWIYFPGVSTWGPTNEKHSTKFFIRNMSNEEGWKIIDSVTGGGYEDYLEKQDVETKKLLKQASRLNLFGPSMIEVAKIDLRKDYVVYIDCELNALGDVDEETEKKLKEYGVELGRNINDGKSYIGAEGLVERLGITLEEALTLALQTRANLFCTKTLSESVLCVDLEVLVEILEKLFEGHVHVFGNRNGRCMYLADKDGAKLPALRKLRRAKFMKVYCLNIAKASNSRTSGQLLVKALTKDYDATIERCIELVTESLDEQFMGNVDGFNPFTGTASATKAVLGDKIVMDESSMFNALHDLSNFARSSIAELKVPVMSVYDHCMFDDCFVYSGGFVRNTLGIRFDKNGQYYVECYSRDANVLLEDITREILNDNSLSESEKYERLIEERSAAVIKYPSAGVDESLPIYYVTEDEYRAMKEERKEEMRKAGASEQLVVSYDSYVERSINVFGVTIICALNFVKSKLAGMDVDFDAMLAIIDRMKKQIIDMTCTVTIIDYFDKSKAKYNFGQDVKRANLKF